MEGIFVRTFSIILLLVIIFQVGFSASDILASSEKVNRYGVTLTKGQSILHVYPDGRFYVVIEGIEFTSRRPRSFLSILYNGKLYTNYYGALSTSYLIEPSHIEGDSIITKWMIDNEVVLVQNITFINESLIKVQLTSLLKHNNFLKARYIIDTYINDVNSIPFLFDSLCSPLLSYQSESSNENKALIINKIFTIIFDNKNEPKTYGIIFDNENTPYKLSVVEWGYSTHSGWAIRPKDTNSNIKDKAIAVYYLMLNGTTITFYMGRLRNDIRTDWQNFFQIGLDNLFYYPGEEGLVIIAEKDTIRDLVSFTTKDYISGDRVSIINAYVLFNKRTYEIFQDIGSLYPLGITYMRFRIPPAFLTSHPDSITMMLVIHSEKYGDFIVQKEVKLTKQIARIEVDNKNYYIETSFTQLNSLNEFEQPNYIQNTYIVDEEGNLVEITSEEYANILRAVINEVLPKLFPDRGKIENVLSFYRPVNMYNFYAYTKDQEKFSLLLTSYDILGRMVDAVINALKDALLQLTGQDFNYEDEVVLQYAGYIEDAILLRAEYGSKDIVSSVFSELKYFIKIYSLWKGFKDLLEEMNKDNSIESSIGNCNKNILAKTYGFLWKKSHETLKEELGLKDFKSFLIKLGSIIKEFFDELMKNKKFTENTMILINYLDQVFNNEIDSLVEEAENNNLDLFNVIIERYRRLGTCIGVLLIIKSIYVDVINKYQEYSISSPIYDYAKIMNKALTLAISDLYKEFKECSNLLNVMQNDMSFIFVLVEDQILSQKYSDKLYEGFYLDRSDTLIFKHTLASSPKKYIIASILSDPVSNLLNIIDNIREGYDEAAVKLLIKLLDNIMQKYIENIIQDSIEKVLNLFIKKALVKSILFAYDVYNFMLEALGVIEVAKAYEECAQLLLITSSVPEVFDISLSIPLLPTINTEIGDTHYEYMDYLRLGAIKILKLSFEYKIYDKLQIASDSGCKFIKMLINNLIKLITGSEPNSGEYIQFLQEQKEQIRNKVKSLYQELGSIFFFISTIYNNQPLPYIEISDVYNFRFDVDAANVKYEINLPLYIPSIIYNNPIGVKTTNIVTAFLTYDSKLYSLKEYWNYDAQDNKYYLGTVFTFKLEKYYLISFLPNLKSSLFRNINFIYKIFLPYGSEVSGIVKPVYSSGLLASVPMYTRTFIEKSFSGHIINSTYYGWYGSGITFGGYAFPIMIITDKLPVVFLQYPEINLMDFYSTSSLRTLVFLATQNIHVLSRPNAIVVDDPNSDYKTVLGTGYNLASIAAKKYHLGYAIEDIISTYNNERISEVISSDLKRISFFKSTEDNVKMANLVTIPVYVNKTNNDITVFKLLIDNNKLGELLETHIKTGKSRIMIISYTFIYDNVNVFNTKDLEETLKNFEDLVLTIANTLYKIDPSGQHFILDLTGELSCIYGTYALSMALYLTDDILNKYKIRTAIYVDYTKLDELEEFINSWLINTPNLYIVAFGLNDYDVKNELININEHIEEFILPRSKTILFIEKPLINDEFTQLILSTVNRNFRYIIIGLSDVGLPANSIINTYMENIIVMYNYMHRNRNSVNRISFYELETSYIDLSEIADKTIRNTSISIKYEEGQQMIIVDTIRTRITGAILFNWNFRWGSIINATRKLFINNRPYSIRISIKVTRTITLGIDLIVTIYDLHTGHEVCQWKKEGIGLDVSGDLYVFITIIYIIEPRNNGYDFKIYVYPYTASEISDALNDLNKVLNPLLEYSIGTDSIEVSSKAGLKWFVEFVQFASNTYDQLRNLFISEVYGETIFSCSDGAKIQLGELNIISSEDSRPVYIETISSYIGRKISNGQTYVFVLVPYYINEHYYGTYGADANLG